MNNADNGVVGKMIQDDGTEQTNVLKQLMDNDDLEIEAVEGFWPNDCEEIKLSKNGKMQVQSVMQYIPQVIGVEQLASAYRIRFPKGINGTLMQLKSGGYSTSIINTDNKIIGQASLLSMTSKAAVLGAFTFLSIITGQFFLANINKKLDEILLEVGKVLEFLEQDKRSEMYSSVKFVEYVSENFQSIMQHSEQRVATLTNIQECKRNAERNFKFYISELEKVTNESILEKKKEDTFKNLNNVYKIISNLDLAFRLYVMSSIMEINYAQNFEEEYLDYIKKGVEEYIIAYFGSLNGIKTRINEVKNKYPNELKEQYSTFSKLLDSDINKYKEDVEKYITQLNDEKEYYFVPSKTGDNIRIYAAA